MSRKLSSFGKSMRTARNTKVRSALTLAVAAIALHTANNAFAGTKIWLDTDGLFWSNSAGWTPAVVPVIGDDVQVGTHSTVTASPTLNFLSNLTGAGLNSLNINSNGSGLTGTMTFSQTGSTSAMVATTEIIGDTISGNVYTQNAGSNSATNITIGNAGSGNGVYTLSGSGAVSATNFIVGNSGTGLITQSGGAFTLTTLTLGNGNSSSGSFNLSGNGSLGVGSAVLGNGGSSSFFQSNGTFSAVNSVDSPS